MPETAVMNQAVVIHQDQALTATEIRAQVHRIQEVLRDVMQENTHYGKVPGTPKPSLWKPGAEKLGFTFHIATDPTIEADLSTPDVIRYRIRCSATHQGTGAFLGSALGECSSDEEKYRWRAAVCQEEWDETPVDRRRKKWKKSDSGAYSIMQVRTEPADIANTVLKMAVKRAEVAVILKVTAASDIFTQDLEDIPDEVRDQVDDSKPQKPTNGSTQSAGAKPQQPSGTPISDAQRNRAFAIGRDKGWSTEGYRDVIRKHGFATDRDIMKGAKYDAIIAELQKGPGADVPTA